MNVLRVSEAEYQHLAATAGQRLNIGCGEAPMMFWLNLDADEKRDADIHAQVPPLPFDDETFHEIYCGHMLEHLPRDEAKELLLECHRALIPGGRLGILVPDTREIMRRYLAGSIDAAEYPVRVWHRVADLDDVCAMFLYSTIQDSPHRWSYDMDTLARLMVETGFEKLNEIDRYADDRIAQGAWYQCGIDGYKPQQNEPWLPTFDDGGDDERVDDL